MRFTSPATVAVMRNASQGPAAMALAKRNQIVGINKGLRAVRVITADTMRTGGSLGALGVSDRGYNDFLNQSLGCTCGPGDPKFLGSLEVPRVVKIGPIAARMIQLRRNGKSDRDAYLDAMFRLHASGETVVTPAIHLQLAAGLQPLPSALSGLLGALGLAPVVGAGVTAGGLAASGVGTAAAGALGIGAGIALGQTVIPIPVVGAVVGAVVFEAVHLMQRHVGTAEAAWTSPGFYASLDRIAGRDYDEHQFSEAFKGMMDTGNNIIPGCGPDRHKDPDCFMQPLAKVIANGYLTQTVPLSAETAQVFPSVVLPWLQSGASGLVNWANLSKETIQQKMIRAATDRYIAGEAVTRGDMPSYGNQGLHTPTLVQALAPMLQQPTTNTPQVPGVLPPANPAIQPGVIAPGYVQPTGGGALPVPGTDPGSYYLNPPPSQPPTLNPQSPGMPIYSAPPVVGYNPPVALPAMPAPIAAGAGGGSGLPSWVLIGAGVLALGFALARPASKES